MDDRSSHYVSWNARLDGRAFGAVKRGFLCFAVSSSLERRLHGRGFRGEQQSARTHDLYSMLQAKSMKNINNDDKGSKTIKKDQKGSKRIKKDQKSIKNDEKQ